MKTRLIKTSIYFEDDWFNSLSLIYKFFFIYLFTNSHIGQTGIYNLSDRVIKLETGLTQTQIEEGKKILYPKVLFHKSWVHIIHANRYNEFSGEKNMIAYQKELASIPSDIKDTLLKNIDTPSIDYPYHMDSLSNHNNINNNINKNNNNKNSILEDFINFFNSESGKHYQLSDDRIKKLELRLKKYSMDELKKATANLLKSPFHTGHDPRGNPTSMWYATPDFLLRSDDQVDKWLNAQPTKKEVRLPDFIKNLQADY